MRVWTALLVAPLLALTDESVALAVVSWACAHQSAYAIHLVHLLFLAGTAGCAAMAGQAWHKAASRSGGGESLGQVRFLAPLATASAALSTLAIAAMWIPTWLIASCLG
jgi:hypothetical protein